MRKCFLVFGSPMIERPEIDEVVKSLKSGWLGTGYKVRKFEEMFRKYKDVKYAMAVSSCSAAAHLSLIASGVKRKDEVIVPTMTFAATAAAVAHTGAIPVFADCRKDTMNIDPADIARKMTPRTKALVPVHFAGRPCDMDMIMDIAKKKRLKVIEDCAHAIESEYRGKKTGTFGDLGCFSFYATKNITTGEGGMVITDNKEYEKRVKIFALHGMTESAWGRFSDKRHKHYKVICCGYKYSMTDIQAAIGIHQLPRIDVYWKRRRSIWDRYNKAFEDLPVFTPAPTAKDIKHSYHLYTLILDIDNLRITRDRFLDEMIKRRIGVGVHYVALHLHPYYQKNFGYRRGDFPNAEWISDRTISLPISPKLTDEDVNDVIYAVKRVIKLR